MNFWKNNTVVVTGADGFLGRHVISRLQELGATKVYTPELLDLRERESAEEIYERFTPTVIIHLAARVGGIMKNVLEPANMIYDNLKMGMELIQAGRNTDTKIVMMGSACEYPQNAPIPMREFNVFNGQPEKTNAAYGIAKRTLLTLGQAYREQYEMNIIHLLSTNLYGPGDNFGDGSHVLPATIRRCIEARDASKDSLTLWGTGKATRDFLFVDDAVTGILLAAEHYNEAGPINLGSGHEISIYDAAEKINLLTGFNGELLWDGKMPDGQPRRFLATNLAKEKFGFEAKTSLDDGLRETISWYQEKLRSER